MKIRIIVAMLAIAVLPGIASAQTPSDKRGARIDARQAAQQQRIDKGVASGQLNKAETARLEHGQARVQKMEGRAKADGKVTKAEAAKIDHQQNVQSRRIFREKHDKTTAANRP